MDIILKYFCSSVVLLALLISCDNKESYPTTILDSDSTHVKPPDSLQEATVECAYVADGDTWYYYYNNKKYSVRVLGIDCFETSINDRLATQAKTAKINEDSALALGLIAKKLADSLLKKQQVIIKRSISAPNYDVYDRLLRYCYIEGRKKYDSIIIYRRLDANTFNR